MAYILVADDDKDFAEATATVLRDDGHEVDVKLEVEEALESIQERRPDLLVLDVMFPEDASAGFEAARKIQELGRDYKQMPVLMLTAINQRFPLGFGPEEIDENWLPVSDFMEKPVDFSVLRKKVDDLLEQAESAAAEDSGSSPNAV